MKTVEPGALPVAVEETAEFGIILPDGRRLSARRWTPVGAENDPVPAILEYLPYRKRDGTAARDALTHPYLAGHGYACVRVDIQGTGESEGLFDDEYSPQELRDGCDVIAWIAAQPWCSGAVAMIGISWGGFNGLQIAAMRPPALKAVVSICSTVDRYADDIHYKGGCLLGENPGWAATVLSWFSLPPDPALVGDGWREIWRRRLEATPFLAGTWTRHQLRDAYWRHGSVCEDYAAIEAAVLSVGGWHDGYRNAISHLVANLKAPVKGIVGPWNHKYPHFARPGPTIGFLQEMLRWFDRWLKGVANGAENDPAYRAYLVDGIPPAPDYDHRPGRWIAEAEWPSSRIEARTLHLTDTGLADAPGPCNRLAAHHADCGRMAGEYFPFGFGPGELPDDQRADDALSACFDGAPALDPLDIVGAPAVRLTLAADKPRAQIAVRLCDVAPDGASALISYGVLNLRHRDGHDHAADLAPGEAVEVALSLDQCAYRLPAGHRLRVAVSAGYWPFMWPEPEAATLTIFGGALSLPLRPLAKGDEWTFAEAEAAPALPVRKSGDPSQAKRIETDVAAGLTRIVIEADHGETEDLTHGLVVGSRVREVWSIRKGDPCSARVDIDWERWLRRGDWSVRSVARLSQWADRENFHIDGRLDTFDGDKPFFARAFAESVPRA